MKGFVYSAGGEKTGEIELPAIFSQPVRRDIVEKAFVIERSCQRQDYGSKRDAGKRHAVASWGVGRGVARLPRLTNGSKAAFAPQAVGGRRTHPPKVERVWKKKLNKKEKMKAFCSAFAATARSDMVSLRGHRFNESLILPIVTDESFEEMERVKEVVSSLTVLGIYDDVLRAFNGRKRRKNGYRTPRSILIIAREGSPIFRSAGNIVGIDVKSPEELRISDLAPGGVPGRLVVYGSSTMESLKRWCR